MILRGSRRSLLRKTNSRHGEARAKRAPNQSPGLFAYAILYLAFLYVPVLFLPLFSFNDSAFIAFPLTRFTLRWYREMLADQAMGQALVNSLKVGAATAIISTLLGLLAARALTRWRVRGGSIALGFVSLPLFIPDIVLGISLLILVNMVGIPLSLLSVVAGHVCVCVPFAIAVLMSRLEGFDVSLEEASRDLGENALLTFVRVILPLALPGIVASLLLTFIVSFDEFLIAYFLAGTEATLPIYIWGELRFPQKLPVVLALGATVLVATTLLVVFAEWVRSLGASRAKPIAVGA
jgi:spermidine/putrescine transport system permease protein